jgi:predicted glycosyltransferase
MRYLVFTNTPAHVHLYKHAIAALRSRGHEVAVLARDYDCTEALLSYYDLPYRIYGKCNTTKGSLFRELPGHFVSIFRQARRFDPDLIFGMGSYAAFASAVTDTPAVLILDSEPTSLDHAVSKPFATALVTPEAFRKDLGAKHYRFAGFKECAYLHPEVFGPDPTIRADLGVGPDEPFAIVRLNAFGSHHDVGRSGFDREQRLALLDRLSEHATVFVSDEGGDLDVSKLSVRSFDLHPARIHDALAAADLLVADTGTMVTEAALLGTPAVRLTNLSPEEDFGNFLELERAGLIENHREYDAAVETAIDLLVDPSVEAVWQRRREAYVADKVNLTELIVEIAERGGAVEEVSTVERERVAATTGA